MHPPALSLDGQRKAVRLYQSGLSAQRVADRLRVDIKTIYRLFRRLKIARRSPAETNRLQYEARPVTYEIKQRLTAEDERLKLAATMLYWAEGYKVSNAMIDFANSDPAMVAIFVKFLRVICGVQETKLRGSIYCYEGQNVAELTEFWCTVTGIPKSQFIKPYIKAATTPGPRGPRMLRGLVHVRYCDKKLLRQILQWIEEYRP